MLWIILLFLTVVKTEDSLEKFKKCNNQKCILVRCYFPVPEFLIATRNEMKLFDDFIEQHHIFLDYHLCNDLSADNMDEVGACMYGVLFKLYQFDANLTIHQRTHVQQALIQEEAIAIVMDMISNILYRIPMISKANELENIIRNSDGEDLVVINAQSLIAQVHLEISRIILNYGSWFTFVYSTIESDEKITECLYRVYTLGRGASGSNCAIQNNIQMTLEQQIDAQISSPNSIKSFFDLTHINVFKRLSSILFYIHTNSTFNLISYKNMIVIPVNMLSFNASDRENHVFLHEPYPFYLFWSAKENVFQRLGDQPSNELLDSLIREEQEEDLRNDYGMFDDEVRHLADAIKNIKIDPSVFFLKDHDDYHRFLGNHSNTAILFTVRWDSTSKLARKTFHEIAPQLKKFISMIDIDCFDWTDLCDEENIFEWPTLLLIENKIRKKIYVGSTDKNEMALALFRFSVKQPYLIEDDSNEMLIEKLLARQHVIVTARIQHEEKILYDTYKSLVDMFSDNEHIFFIFQYSTESSSLIVKQQYGDALLQPKTMTHTFSYDFSDLQKLIMNALRVPLIPFDPLDIIKSTAATFIAASYAQLIDNSLSKDVSTEIPLIWIDTNSPWVLTINQYGPIPYPAVIYVNFSNGKVYVNSDFNDIDAWLKTAQMGTIAPFYELPSTDIDEGPTQEAIDFKKQMYDERLLDELRLFHEESEKLNEHGLGFDMNGLPIEMNN
ncbi:unnamed protein product [Rotaria magnacalcarata]|uniref:Thioredoxin domain-containing protein n=1 Tax=Rotaria magnacalcarata TaxID=392030 RepID=A0A815DYQ0_9BILA|nr:unnamed protein product [Rotaria magnacalcarata]CAF1375932.1 unnamed protein product [Rotaria magnacalcarata]CAF2105976.1 unnamed protein product [Rotaria magnacalcarata]